MKLVKEIKSRDGKLHFRRYQLLSLPIFSIYIHRIFRGDEDEYEHTHPWNFLSVVLSGSYVEQSEGKKTVRSRQKNPLVFSSRMRTHKILEVIRPTTTLFFTIGRRGPWFYKVSDDYWITNEQYRKAKRG